MESPPRSRPKAKPATLPLEKFLLEEGQDLVFVIPRGTESVDILELIGQNIAEPSLILSEIDFPTDSKLLKWASLDEELTPSPKIVNLLIAAAKPYFPAYNFEGVRNIFVLAYPVPERTTNGIANYFIDSVWIRVGGGDRLRLNKIDITMSPRQAENYQEVRKLEIKAGKSGKQKEQYEASIRLRSLQAGNFIYPEALQKELRKPRERRAKLKPDLTQEEGGWIDPEDLEELEADNPKFFAALALLSPDKKTVIYTRFKEHYGSTLFQTLAQIQGHEVEVLSGDVKSIKQRTAIIKAFNKAKTGNLILTILPPIPIKGVDQLIFLEGVEVTLLNKIVSMVSGSVARPLHLIFMVAQRSADLSFYRPFERSISNQINAFNSAVERCSYEMTPQGDIVRL